MIEPMKGGVNMATRRIELKKLRIERNLTQDELAKKLGVSVGTYSFVESGKKRGSEELWLKIQKVFSIPDEQMWTIQNPKKQGSE